MRPRAWSNSYLLREPLGISTRTSTSTALLAAGQTLGHVLGGLGVGVGPVLVRPVAVAALPVDVGRRRADVAGVRGGNLRRRPGQGLVAAQRPHVVRLVLAHAAHDPAD